MPNVFEVEEYRKLSLDWACKMYSDFLCIGLLEGIYLHGQGGNLQMTHLDAYSGRTAPLTSKCSFYIFIQRIYVLNILNMVYGLRFFS